MGNTSSYREKERERTRILYAELQEKALRNFDARVRNYHYAYHGPYVEYVEWCRMEYEMECIPEVCRYSANCREMRYKK